jgi:hypothetical protein
MGAEARKAGGVSGERAKEGTTAEISSVRDSGSRPSPGVYDRLIAGDKRPRGGGKKQEAPIRSK